MNGKEKILDQLKKEPPREVNKEKTLFSPTDDFSVRGPAISS